MRKWIWFIVAMTLMFYGCSKKTAQPPEKNTVETAKPVLQKMTGPQPGIEFFDAAKQQRYETLFRDYLAQFEAPAQGSALWLKLCDGRRIGGNVEVVQPDAILLLTSSGVEHLKIVDLAMESRPLVFAGEFARRHAMRQMTGETDLPSAAADAAPEIRYAMSDDIIPRIGPGGEFKSIAGVHFSSGDSVKVVAEYNGWLQLRDTGVRGGCWIPKYLTFPLDESNLAALQTDVDALSRLGLLQGIDTGDNTADVDPNVWRGTDPQVRMGVARALASYCAAKRGNSLVFVTIRDKETQRRLGKYSRGQGWKDAAL